MDDYPSDDKLAEILKLALEAFEKGLYEPVRRRSGEPSHMAKDIERLEAVSDWTINPDDYWEIVIDCLELAQTDPSKYYKEPEDPICTGHHEIYGKFMWAFVVKLEDFRLPIYTKFCLTEYPDGTHYIHIDCHP